MRNYRSSIPKAARERVVATFITGPEKYMSRLTLDGEIRGIRFFHETGELSAERPLRNGRLHGVVYRSDLPGKLTSAAPYLNGLPHGVARQRSNDGKLMGTSTMVRGTGLDLWWCELSERGVPFLSEARYFKDGALHGFEWWLNEDQRTVHAENHFHHGQRHGIERSWNIRGTLRRGYPKHWVRNRLVTKRRYLQECANDASLPAFIWRDNLPHRTFPPEVTVHQQ